MGHSGASGNILKKERDKMEERNMECFINKKQCEVNREDYEKLEQYKHKQFIETLRKCLEEGIPCEYGICDECPINK